MLTACFVNSHSLGSNKQLFRGRPTMQCARSHAESVQTLQNKMIQRSASYTSTVLFVIDRVIIRGVFIFIEQVTPYSPKASKTDHKRSGLLF